LVAAFGVATAAHSAETVIEPATSLEAPAGDAPAVRALIGDGVLLEGAPVVRLGAPEDFVGVDMYPTGGDPVTCMTQAIYYEARSESEVGQQAVAQVVMNRTRSPNFPHSVCGVVYQGWERATGCQFTFVCDGSLRPPRDPVAWERARLIAIRAVAGYTYKPMLGATHYHAAWMTPYWSGEFTKIRQIGGHVFYR
jgi:hypothetical protein